MTQAEAQLVRNLKRREEMIFFLTDLLARSNAHFEVLLQILEEDKSEKCAVLAQAMQACRAELEAIKLEFISEMFDPENNELVRN